MTFKISRASAVESAMNSMITEGFTFTEEEKTLYNDIAKGDKDLNSVDEYVDNLILKWKKENLKYLPTNIKFQNSLTYNFKNYKLLSRVGVKIPI